MKFIFTFIICWLSFCANAQKRKLLLEVKGLPVRDGGIYKLEKYPGSNFFDGCSSGGTEIISTTDSVFSVVDGIVVNTFNLDKEFFVAIKTKKELFFCFSNLQSISVKKGDAIKRGDFIGVINLNEENILTLIFIISNNKGTFFSEEKIIKFLEDINPVPCTIKDQPIVAR